MSILLLEKNAASPGTPGANQISLYMKADGIWYYMDDTGTERALLASAVTSVIGTSPIASSGGTTPAISLNDTAVTPAAYTNASITVDQKGRITAASSGTAPVTSVSGTAPIASSGGATPAISLNDTAVTPGAYTNASLTVDQKGRLTAASSGITWSFLTKPADTNRANTVTISNDPDLALAVAANKNYIIRMTWAYAMAGATAGFRWRIVGPASPTAVMWKLRGSGPTSYSSVGIANSAYDAADQLYSADTSPLIFSLEMLLQNGANAGTVALSWAQANSSASATTVRGGSVLQYALLN